MEVLYSRCAGLDVHKDTVVACLRTTVDGTARREVRTFKTTTKALLELSEWLASEGCTDIVMEATGVYWKPVWHILGDGEFELLLANAAHVKNVPGRKTDVNDATWLADLLAHGLIRGSFVPDTQTQEMRGLLRTRKQLVRERTSHVQRLQKTLEDANIKLDSVIADIIGLSGRSMIEALIGGETDPDRLAALAHRRIKAPAEVLREALRGRVTRHHRFLLRLHLQQIDALDAAIAGIDQEVDDNVEPFRIAIRLLTTIPGISDLSASIIVAEIGTDMSRFPTEGHLISPAFARAGSGPVCVPEMTKALASGDPIACARARRGSRPRSSNVPGRGCARKAATFRPSSIGCGRGAAQRKRLAPWRPPSSPPATTCWPTAPCTRISVQTISTAGPKPLTRSASSADCKASDMTSR
jgi:transposase